MFFRLFNILTSFQGYINKILAKKLDIFDIVYFNRIFIYIENLAQDYIKAISWLLDILKKHWFFINLKKYQFYKDKVHF